MGELAGIVGVVLCVFTKTLPNEKWRWCNGDLLLKSEYPELANCLKGHYDPMNQIDSDFVKNSKMVALPLVETRSFIGNEPNYAIIKVKP